MVRLIIQNSRVKDRLIAFRVDDKTYIRLKEIAKRYDISVSEAVRQMVDITLDKLSQ